MENNSGRLIFKEFNEEDLDLFYSVFSNEQTMKYALLDRYTRKEDILPYFRKVLENNKTINNREAYEYAVYLCSNGDFICFADIEVYNQNNFGGCGEIGYFLLPEFWGNGFATEIANMLLNICFSHLNLHRVSASCNSNNLQSEKIMKKIGMVKEGELRKTRFKNGNWDNELKYSILVEEWKQKCLENT